MTDAAAFRAQVLSVRDIPTRKVVQIVLEAPIEHHAQVAQVAKHDAWCAVALLKPETEEKPESTPNPRPHKAPQDKTPAGGERERKSPAQVAGYLCTLPIFWRFLNERKPIIEGRWHDPNTYNEYEAADAVRWLCQVEHRSEIKTGEPSGDRWQKLLADFRTFEREAEVVPA